MVTVSCDLKVRPLTPCVRNVEPVREGTHGVSIHLEIPVVERVLSRPCRSSGSARNQIGGPKCVRGATAQVGASVGSQLIAGIVVQGVFSSESPRWRRDRRSASLCQTDRERELLPVVPLRLARAAQPRPVILLVASCLIQPLFDREAASGPRSFGTRALSPEIPAPSSDRSVGGEADAQPSLQLCIDDHDRGPVPTGMEVVLSDLAPDGRFGDTGEVGRLGNRKPKRGDRHGLFLRHTTIAFPSVRHPRI